MGTPPDEVSVEEAAAILGLSRSTVVGLLDNGALTFRLTGDVGQEGKAGTP